MASFKLKFRPSAVQGKGGTLYFQVVHGRSTSTVCAGCRVAPHEWNGESSSLRIGGTPERQAELRLAASKLKWCGRQLAAIIAEKEQSRVDYTAADVVAAYRLLPPCQTWFGFIRAMIDRLAGAGRCGTAKTYRDALASFSAFRGLRTLYRRAAEAGLTADRRIFSHVFTGFARTAKRAIPTGSLRAICRLSLPAGSSLAFARDMFMLCVYLQGMSFVDLAYLKKTDIRNGLLQYCRKKTGQCISIGWEPAMQEIVDAYGSRTVGSPYLLPIITAIDGTERRQYERAEHRVNRNLKKIGEMAGLRIPLTTYVGRHTWASMMRDMGFSLSVVSKGLGHESLKTTQIYLSSIDTDCVAKANRKVIGRIIGK